MDVAVRLGFGIGLGIGQRLLSGTSTDDYLGKVLEGLLAGLNLPTGPAEPVADQTEKPEPEAAEPEAAVTPEAAEPKEEAAEKPAPVKRARTRGAAVKPKPEPEPEDDSDDDDDDSDDDESDDAKAATSVRPSRTASKKRTAPVDDDTESDGDDDDAESGDDDADSEDDEKPKKKAADKVTTESINAYIRENKLLDSRRQQVRNLVYRTGHGKISAIPAEELPDLFEAIKDIRMSDEELKKTSPTLYNRIVKDNDERLEAFKNG